MSPRFSRFEYLNVASSDTTRKHPVFGLYFQFLMMSPSYELARKHNANELSIDDEKRIPDDFEVVLENYRRVGDVRNIDFMVWWRSRGKALFGREDHQVDSVKFVNYEISRKSNAVIGKLDPMNPSDFLVAVPISLKFPDALAQTTKLLTSQKHFFSTRLLQHGPQSSINILKVRVHGEKLQKGLRLIQIKALEPKLSLWQLGLKAKTSDMYCKLLKKADKNILEYEFIDEKKALGKLVSRSIISHEAIIENAARGVFPSEEKLKHKFNYKIAKDLIEYYEENS